MGKKTKLAGEKENTHAITLEDGSVAGFNIENYKETKPGEGGEEMSASFEITNVKLIEPPPFKFSVPEQEPVAPIKTDVTNEVQISIDAGDITPVIPQILTKVLFMKDWKTSLLGFGGALVVAIGDYMKSGGKMTLSGVGTALGLAALGWFSSDKKN